MIALNYCTVSPCHRLQLNTTPHIKQITENLTAFVISNCIWWSLLCPPNTVLFLHTANLLRFSYDVGPIELARCVFYHRKNLGTFFMCDLLIQENTIICINLSSDFYSQYRCCRFFCFKSLIFILVHVDRRIEIQCHSNMILLN